MFYYLWLVKWQNDRLYWVLLQEFFKFLSVGVCFVSDEHNVQEGTPEFQRTEQIDDKAVAQSVSQFFQFTEVFQSINNQFKDRRHYRCY